MKILLATHRVPYPLEWGQHLRLYHLARELTQRHELHLVAFGEAPCPPEITRVFRRIRTLPIPPAAGCSLGLGRLVHAFAVDYMLPRVQAMADLIDHTLRVESPEVVWIGGPDMLVYFGTERPTRLVADVMDEGVLERLRYLVRARDPVAVLHSLKWLVNTARWQRRYFRCADRCVFVSAVDARWARRVVPGIIADVVENGVDVDFFHPLGGEENFPSMVFEGNQAFPPNVDAVGFFVRDILPRVRRRFPRCRFYVVGRDPGPSTRALAGDRIVVTGRVDDVRPYLDRASVFVCPMRTGAGIKNKILQAWAMGKPVVATPVAVGGLQAISGQNILVAKGATAFAEATQHLLNDPIARRELGKTARETVLTRYTWEHQARALERVLEGL